MNWIESIKSIAPTVASALSGPLAGAAVASLGSIFGVSEPTQEKIGRLFSDSQITSDHLAELRKLEMQYLNDEKERGFRYVELEFKNTADARDMQKQTRSYFPATLSSIVVIGFFGILIALMVKVIAPTESLLVMLGQLSAGFAAVLNFWLGSSNGSQSKDKLLADAGTK